MPGTALSLSSLIISIVLLVCGNAYLTTLLGLRLSIEQLSPSVIGWILVCYSLGFVGGSLYAGKAVNRVGHIRAFAVYAALLACVVLIHALSLDPVLWAVLRAVAGFAVAGLMIVVESWFSSRATQHNRASLFAVYQLVFFISTVAGQVLIRAADPAGFAPFSIAAILIILALVPLSLTRQQSPHIESGERMSLRQLYRRTPTGMWGALLSGLLVSSFYNMGPVFANQIGLSTAQVSNFMASAIAGAMILAWPVGRLCDRMDRYRVMLLGTIVATLASLGAAFWGTFHPLILIVLGGLYMGIGAALYPIAVAITNDLMESTQITAASTALLLSYGVGSCIGPVLSALIMEFIGPSGLFLTGSCMLLAMIGFMVVKGGVRSPLPPAQWEDFITTSPEASLGLAEMDPRNPDFSGYNDGTDTSATQETT